jgi:hypothetical protein
MQYTIGSFVLIATVTVTLGGAAKLYLGGADGETTGRIASALGAEGPAIAAGDGGDDAGDVGFDLSAAADMLPGFEPESVLAVAGLAGVPGIPTFGKKGDSPFGALPVSKRDKRDQRDRDMPPGDRPRGDPDGPKDDPDCTGTTCNKPGKQCFGAGTLVVTADGLVPIESLALGDLVLTRSTPDQPLVERAVTAAHETPGKPILEIWIHEEGGEPELIEVTPRHPFWVADEGWVDSDQLAPGDALSTADGDAASVLSVASTARTETVYNLTVAEHHTYFVGTSETWVHNLGKCGEDRDQRTTWNSKNCPVGNYTAGSGFSGAYDPNTGDWVAVASGDAALTNPDPSNPITTVNQFGGHREAEANLPGGKGPDNVGFVIVYDGNGEAEVRWNSRTINARNFGGNRTAPDTHRQAIIDAIQKSCSGINVRG